MKATEFPIEFICPLTRKVMVDPVVIQSGNTFERNAIENYLDKTEGIASVLYVIE